MSGDAGDKIYRPRSHFSYYTGILGAALYLGSRDEFSLSPSVRIGFQPGAGSSTLLQANLALGYAFQLPKGNNGSKVKPR